MEITVILSLVLKIYKIWVDKIWTGHIHIIAACLDLNITIIEMFYYPLVDFTLTEKESN